MGHLYPLPKFPPQLRELFPKLCEPIPDNEIDKVREAITQHFLNLQPSAMFIKEEENLMQRVARCALALIDAHAGANHDHRALIGGAVSYVLQKVDFIPDEIPLIGLDDDVAVLNHVAEELGRLDLVILP